MTSKNSRTRAAVLVLTLLMSSISGHSEHAVNNLKALYDAHEWFQLRAAVNKSKVPAFYKGAVESVFNKTLLAEKTLQSVIMAAPKSEEAYYARALLVPLYLRSGRYRAALAQNEQMIVAKPGQSDTRETQSFLSILGRYPDQTVERRISSKIRYRLSNGNFFLPVVIGSKKALYIIDTAASISTISESEAKRLNLKVHDSRATTESETGGEVGVRIAVAEQLSIGNFRLANVAFFVVPDEQPPFVRLPPGEKGIIGLPVLLTFQTAKFGSDGTLEIGAPVHHALTTEPNLCFEDIGLITNAMSQHRQIAVVLDTGATHSQLWPLFARDFPGVVAQGKRDSVEITGVAGPTQVPVMLVPDIDFSIGGTVTALHPAIVFLRHGAELSQWYYGDIGVDVLAAHGFTMDFRSMSLRLEE